MFLGFLEEMDWGLGVWRRVCGGGGVECVGDAVVVVVVAARFGVDLCLFMIATSVLFIDCIGKLVDWAFGDFSRVCREGKGSGEKNDYGGVRLSEIDEK